MVPGLSTSSSSSYHPSTSMTPSRQESHHPTSTSCSSSSPTMTSSAVSSDDGTRAREDLSGIDSYPVSVSSEHVEVKERGDLCSSGTPEEQLVTKQTKIQNKSKTKTTIKNGETCVIPTYRNGCKSSEKISWMIEFLNAETHTPVLLMKYL